jgi:hypothetical protein
MCQWPLVCVKTVRDIDCREGERGQRITLIPARLTVAFMLRLSRSGYRKKVIAMNGVFNALVEREGRDPEFARAYAAESARIEATRITEPMRACI